ncbi:MAG: flagellar basal body-associated FliL family protein [Desulfobacula sp.]|nr:flagellar basal body-associated FliL family protein [Desulfobacula sp.]
MDIKGLFGKFFKKFSKKKVIIIIISIIVFIVLLALVLIFFLKSDKDETAVNKASEAENIQINQINYDNIIVLKPFTWIALNNNSYMGKVSLGIALELMSKDKVEIVEAEIDRIRTLVRSVTAEMRWIELRSSEGKIKFKYMLIKKINSLFPDIVIRNLYLTHFIMR